MTPRTFRKVVYTALLLSVFGLVLVCLPVVGPHYTAKFAKSWLPQLAAGYGAMILVIECAGVPLRSFLTRYWAGTAFAMLVFAAGSLAGSATSMLVYQDFNPWDYVVKPLFWLSIYGMIPAAVIGLTGTAMLRRAKSSGERGAGAGR